MSIFFHSIVQKIAAVAIVVFAAVSGIVTYPRTITITPPPQTATISDAATSLVQDTAATSSAVSDMASDTISTVADIAPSSTLSKAATPKASSTSGTVSPPVPPATKAKTKTAAVPPPQTTIIAAPESLPSVVTPQWFLERTASSMRQKLDGSYGVTLTTNAGAGGTFTWDFAKTTVGGTGGVPQFAASFACDTPPDASIPGADDQTPSFHVRTSYHCNVSLTSVAGNDRRTQSKAFSFQTGAGKIVVTTAANTNTILKDGVNYGGFVFNNEDSQPVTITGLTLDILYSSLQTSASPLVLRFIDPATDQTILDYHLENLPADPTLAHTQSQTGIEQTLSFTIGANTKKMLTVNALGVSKGVFPGTDPSIYITLRKVTTDHSDTKISLLSAQIFWKCIFPTAAYDPLATSSPFMTGTVCQY